MPKTSSHPVRCRLAVCREDLADGNDWSIYLLNDTAGPLHVTVERVSYEWGDRGHSVEPGAHVRVDALRHAVIWRQDWAGAELSMEISLRVEAAGHVSRLSFEFGRLYRRSNPEVIAEIGRAGWVHAPSEADGA